MTHLDKVIGGKMKLDRRKTRIRSDVKAGDVICYRKSWFVPFCRDRAKEGYLPLYTYTGKNDYCYKIAFEDWNSLSFYKEGLTAEKILKALEK